MIDKLPFKARQVLVTWVAAWPTLTLILYCLHPFSAHWPLPIRSLASASGMAVLMNLVSVPLVRRWLIPAKAITSDPQPSVSSSTSRKTGNFDAT